MNKIPFFKMCGSGNDFIIVDNRRKMLHEADFPTLARQLCARTISVGADGFVVVEDAPNADFKWHFFNSDGSRAEMCGNGARCVARFAALTGIAGTDMTFDTDAGAIAARVRGERVKIRMTDPRDLLPEKRVETESGPLTAAFIDTGVPHLVLAVADVDEADVMALGRELRYHPDFAPAGTNVNFAAAREDGRIFNRTYERGVEGESLACGTGSVAAALIMADRERIASPVTVVPRSGETLTVYYQKTEGRFHQVFLEGNARVICTGELWEDAWNWGGGGGAGAGNGIR
jgi:diaminopimelate epimerase